MIPRLSLIVFAYDEAENVAAILLELCQWLDAHAPDTEVLFVDDGSSDSTALEAERVLSGRCARVIRHPTNRGIGAAIKTGVAAASADWITFMPADGQIAPMAIGRLLDASRTDDVDLVLSMYDRRDDGLDRTLLSWGVRALIRGIHGVQLRSEGPYLFRRVLFEVEHLVPDSFFLNFEFPIRMLRKRVRFTTVTIACRPRRAGQSKSAKLSTVLVIARDLLAMRIRDIAR